MLKVKSLANVYKKKKNKSFFFNEIQASDQFSKNIYIYIYTEDCLKEKLRGANMFI